MNNRMAEEVKMRLIVQLHTVQDAFYDCNTRDILGSNRGPTKEIYDPYGLCVTLWGLILRPILICYHHSSLPL